MHTMQYALSVKQKNCMDPYGLKSCCELTLDPCCGWPSAADEPVVEAPPEEAAEPPAAPVVEEGKI